MNAKKRKNQGHEKTRSKNADAIFVDAKAAKLGMCEFILGKVRKDARLDTF